MTPLHANEQRLCFRRAAAFRSDVSTGKPWFLTTCYLPKRGTNMKDLLLWFIRLALSSPKRALWVTSVACAFFYNDLYAPNIIWCIDSTVVTCEQGLKVSAREFFSFCYRCVNGFSRLGRLFFRVVLRKPYGSRTAAWKDGSERALWLGHQTTLNAVVERKARAMNPGANKLSWLLFGETARNAPALPPPRYSLRTDEQCLLLWLDQRALISCRAQHLGSVAIVDTLLCD